MIKRKKDPLIELEKMRVNMKYLQKKLGATIDAPGKSNPYSVSKLEQIQPTLEPIPELKK